MLLRTGCLYFVRRDARAAEIRKRKGSGNATETFECKTFDTIVWAVTVDGPPSRLSSGKVLYTSHSAVWTEDMPHMTLSHPDADARAAPDFLHV